MVLLSSAQKMLKTKAGRGLDLVGLSGAGKVENRQFNSSESNAMLKEFLQSCTITQFCTGDYCNKKYSIIGEWHAFNFY